MKKVVADNVREASGIASELEKHVAAHTSPAAAALVEVLQRKLGSTRFLLRALEAR